ncbi:hypothetical protein [Cupriavidus sp. SK-4]|uniref:hypothetical protein n=1 Tax=Cupriavidus sp. SK-4 TaxID=574750 RepID=UPI0012678F1B|nr:hypothetical protein [Cupriavidus sp. SK-4]
MNYAKTMRNWKKIIGYGLVGVLFGAALALGLEAAGDAACRAGIDRWMVIRAYAEWLTLICAFIGILIAILPERKSPPTLYSTIGALIGALIYLSWLIFKIILIWVLDSKLWMDIAENYLVPSARLFDFLFAPPVYLGIPCYALIGFLLGSLRSRHLDKSRVSTR